MSISIPTYAISIVLGLIISGGIIDISENAHTPDIKYKDTNSDDTLCLDSPYYPCENNITINVGSDKTFSIYPNVPFTTWRVDNKRVMAVNNKNYGQTYITYTYLQEYTIVLDRGVHKIEVDNLIDKHTWYVSVI